MVKCTRLLTQVAFRCLQRPVVRRLLTGQNGPSAAYRGRDHFLLTNAPAPSAAYNCPGSQAAVPEFCLQSVGCLQARAGLSRPLLTVQPLLTSMGRAGPAAAYSPTAAYKHGPGRAGRCLQPNRCLQARAGPSRPLLTEQPLLTSLHWQAHAARCLESARTRPVPAPSYRPPRHRLFAARARRLTLLATERNMMHGSRVHLEPSHDSNVLVDRLTRASNRGPTHGRNRLKSATVRHCGGQCECVKSGA
jgi:hypothetical protein